ncbi:hypothetical protein [Nostoc sp. 'Lobaria pulmonaria (5183) cyanobiont']|uniref:hypothetical protein n=1 Tax=Nostoc sp. 'Lobaria pulmonaria (5183) cyanobiont' TaxID=1618022 RepID=UPI000D0C3F2D|nr:hypothetical protein [Nostoc sp. 'Lobaria pulmonaria (5183) cyanobiont']AVH72485.1 hypothetical protein NLP_3991 [Nostoc sp. 'Lobaria pulmonaria (5183) cyanobiont']
MQQLLTHSMEFPIHFSAKTIARRLSVTLICLTLAGALGGYFWISRFPFPASKWFYELFNLDGEFNIPAWYSSFSLLFCSGLLKAITAIKTKDRHFAYWKTLYLIFFYLSLDEAFSFHEILIIPSVRESLHLNPVFFETWVIPGIVLMGVFAFKYLKFLLHLPHKTRYLFLIAAVVYVGGALGMEMVGGVLRIDFGQRTLISLIGIIGEEFLEMAGIVIFIYALLAYLSSLKESIQLKIYISEK